MENLTESELAFIELLRQLSRQQQQDIIRILKVLADFTQKD